MHAPACRPLTPAPPPSASITLDESLAALEEASAGTFEPRRGEPDAARLEKR